MIKSSALPFSSPLLQGLPAGGRRPQPWGLLAAGSSESHKATTTPFRQVFGTTLRDMKDVLPRPQGISARLKTNPQMGSLTSLRKVLGAPSIWSQSSASPLVASQPGGVDAPGDSRFSSPSQASGVMPLQDYPKPRDDNGRGIHWVPTIASSKETVDRFVREATEMKIKWVVFLNDGTKIGDNDYLVERLVAKGIMPVMRIYTPPGAPLKGDVERLVGYYTQRGVHYFQLFNEPNLKAENGGAAPNVQRYLDDWIPAAKRIVAAGGLPGLGALSPRGDVDDLEFLKQALDGIRARGEDTTLNRAWISMHNYSETETASPTEDKGFLRFRQYDAIVRQKLGRSLPIIGTEGGNPLTPHADADRRQAVATMQAKSAAQSYEYMRQREPYYFAYSYWLIANEEGGGHDPDFRNHALFQPGWVSPVVNALKSLS